MYFSQLLIQMNNRSLFLTFLLLGIGLTLHTDSHAQLPQRYNQQAYLEGLQARQNKLNQSMIKIKSQINDLNGKLNSVDSNSSQYLVLLSEGLAQERDALYNVEIFMRLPFQLRACNCSSLTANQRDSLRNQTMEVNNSLQDLKKQLVDCQNCSIVNEIDLQIRREESYLSTINQMLDTNCSKIPNPLPPQTAIGLVDLSQSMYKNNLLAPNWKYGNTTEDQYRLQVFAQSIKYNLTSCPITEPYVNVNTGQCFNCPAESTYNLGMKTCQSCPEGTDYNVSANKCLSICNQGMLYNVTTKICQKLSGQIIPTAPTGLNKGLCPPQTPFWNRISKNCQACSVATPAYNNSTGNCQACPTGRVWDNNNKRCILVCGSAKIYNPLTDKCDWTSCNDTHPVRNNVTQKCQACPTDREWNDILNKCILICKDNQIYNQTTDKCESTIKEVICDSIKPIWNSATLSCELCPSSTPVWNKTNQICSVCPNETPVFDYSKSQCVQKVCEANLKWNNLKLKCSLISQPCQIYQTYSFELQKCADICKPEQIFNTSTKNCTKKTPNVTTPNVTTPNVTKPNITTPNVTTPNITTPNITVPNITKPNITTPNITVLNTSNTTTVVNTTITTINKTCTDPNSQFSLTSQGCICKQGYHYYSVYNSCKPECQIGYYLNTLSLSCQPITYQTTCGQYMFINSQNKCQCYNGYILRAGGASCRYGCDTGFQYNPVTDSCEAISIPIPTCQSGYIYNPINRQCESLSIACPLGSYYNSQSRQCQSCPSGYVYNTTTKMCQGSLISTCPGGYSYNATSKLCQQSISSVCANGLYYDEATRNCLPSYITSPQTINLITTNMTTYITQYNTQKLNLRIQDCVDPAPFYDKSTYTCVKCPKDYPYFNLETNKCQDCGTAVYSQSTYSCLSQSTAIQYPPTLQRLVMNIL